MIKPESVRIGNLVKYDNRVFRIHTIAEEFPTLDTDEVGIGVVDWNNIDPIELDEGWLVKFDFKYEDLGDDSPYEWYKKDGIALWNFNSEYWLIVINDEELSLEIKSIHTLQNLYFALTSKELTTKQ